jgi:hypothetical protein
MSNETVQVNGVSYRVVYLENEEEPIYKCECSQIIKQEKNLFKHTLTKSHETNLVNKSIYAPPKESLLVPGLIFSK